jgi:hypothetical protein
MNSKLGQRAKETLEAFVPEIELRLKKYFESERGQRFGYSLRQKEVVDKILEHGLEYLLRPQKRARPAFVRYGYALGGKELTNAVWDAAITVGGIGCATNAGRGRTTATT